MFCRTRLGFVVGAFFFTAPLTSRSQVVVPPGSEAPLPPKPETDSAAAVKKDTIKAPFGRLTSPPAADAGPKFEWNREELFASGAYTVADLLERVPGATSFRTGWLASPKFVAVNGDMQRIRVFYDGIELDNLDARSGNTLDLTTIDLWTVEHVVIQRFANELQVHLRSWRVDRTSPYTRTDVYTGDEDTNIYRGYYGKRFDSGAGLQLAGQQWSTRSNRLGGGGDALSFIGRAGIARKSWSFDLYAVRRNAARSTQPTFGTGLNLPSFEGTHTLAYARAAVGNQSAGPWAQLVASQMRLHETSAHVTESEALGRRVRPDTADSTIKRIQYLAAAGFVRGPFRGNVADRIRAFNGEVFHSPEIRLDLASQYATIDLFAQRDAVSERRRMHAIVQLTPLRFLSVTGSISRDSPDDEIQFTDSSANSFVPDSAQPKMTAARVEVGVKLFNPWLIGGYITRDTAMLSAPIVLDTTFRVASAGKRSGVYAGLRGRLYKDINIDVVGTRWDSAGFYQPRYQARSEINLNTRWLKKFPSGTFGLKLAAIHDYRGVVRFPTADGFRFTEPSHVASGLVEIRILRGVASYQVRNVFGKNHQIFPDFFMPRSIGVYGLRWEFWN